MATDFRGFLGRQVLPNLWMCSCVIYGFSLPRLHRYETPQKPGPLRRAVSVRGRVGYRLAAILAARSATRHE